MRNRLIAQMVLLSLVATGSAGAAEPTFKKNPLRDAYYGDLHLHTTYSFDAYLNVGTKIDPDGAFRFARGEEVIYRGTAVRRPEPLDFTAVTDHSELLGFNNQLDDPDSALSRSKLGAALRRGHDTAWDAIGEWPSHPVAITEVDPMVAMRSAWKREIEAANQNYRPGTFTTFIAYEWTSQPDVSNLHRNVIFEGDSAPLPFTSADSTKPEDLWSWLERLRVEGYDVLAIPHNGNASNGLMYDWVDSSGAAIDRNYAQRRQANEPLSEISQNKGQSETNPELSANDEFANYEIFDFLAKWRTRPKAPPGGSYLRDALGRGLVIQDKVGVNPFKYGFVGGSDFHTGLSVSSQANYTGSPLSLNIGANQATPAEAAKTLSAEEQKKADTPPLQTTAGNLTGVWAESNTRGSIFAALRRRETFATTGSRLRFRFFGGWGVAKELVSRADWVAAAYARAVPMGSDLPARPAQAHAPSFAVWAVKDPNGGSLDRVQIIKVWEVAGQQQEKVFDVAWSGDRRVDARTGKLPPVGNTVDLHTGRYDNSVGATELKTVWTDPEFEPRQGAAYYLRVLEIPTPRWSTLLAVKNGLPLPEGTPATIQQRGWSSPIWYTPSQAPLRAPLRAPQK